MDVAGEDPELEVRRLLGDFSRAQCGHSRAPTHGEARIFNRLAVLRAERGLTRRALADAVSVNHQTIGFLEHGDYSPSLTSGR